MRVAVDQKTITLYQLNKRRIYYDRYIRGGVGELSSIKLSKLDTSRIKNFYIIDKNYIPKNTNMIRTNLKQTIPINSVYSITGIAMYNYNKPTAAGLSRIINGVNGDVYSSNLNGYNHASCTVSGYADVEFDCELCAQYSSATNQVNWIILKGFYIEL